MGFCGHGSEACKTEPQMAREDKNMAARSNDAELQK